MLSSKVSGSIGLSNRNEANSLESYLPHDRSHSKPKSIQSPFQHTRPHPLTSACASLNERQIGFGIETLKTNETEIWMLILTEKSETQTWICLFLTSWKRLHLKDSITACDPQQKFYFRGWRDGSFVKSACCSQMW